MTIKERIEKTKKIYIENLKEKQDYYGILKHDLSVAIKFVESYANFLQWTLDNDNE